MDFAENVMHCRTCDDKICMKECTRHLYIPGEIERIEKLIESY